MGKTNFDGFGSLVPKKITSTESQLGYMQVLEYTLQDFSYLHVVQWHKMNILQEDGLPITNTKVFFRSKDSALRFAHDIANKLLQQYD